MTQERPSAGELFALNLKKWRTIKGLSQEKLSELCGLDRTYITGLERQYKSPSLKTIEKISLALNILPEEFFKLPAE